VTTAVATAFDVHTVPLDGINLIEASAGTGKTWAITGLYARLVLEMAMPVKQILVVTYTEAATEELRDRVRARLSELRAAFLAGRSDDPFCRACLARAADPADAVRQLERALAHFDEAAIHTVHGFCQRALRELAFESAMPFDTEILPDERDLLQEIAEDFWRREVYGAPPLFVRYLLLKGVGPDALRRELGGYAVKAHVQIATSAREAGLPDREYRGAFANARTLWHAQRDAVRALLTNHPGLNRQKYAQRHLPAWYAQLDMFFAAAEPEAVLPERIDKFTPAALAAATKAGEPPAHAFFDACAALVAAGTRFKESAELRLLALKHEFLRYARGELPARKQRLQLQSYDDLIANLRAALAAAHGPALVAALRGRYRAALIDEFQDTDPVQYEIFERIYAGTEGPVYFVGDPKQAIYAFRGADLFAYLKARDRARKQPPLGTNWRSVPALIDAINAVFEATPRAFLFEEISYTRVTPPPQERKRLLVEGREEPPLRLWWLGSKEEQDTLAKGVANRRSAQATASEIARLLTLAATGRISIGERPLRGADIAVLVPSHRQGRLVRDALRELGIACVQYAQESVYASHEAAELETVLLAVAEPGREELVRAALATEMLGARAEQIHALGEEASAWQRRFETFHDYYRLWAEHGFMRMFRELLAREQVAPRLLAYWDGERRLTNLYHLGELLQAWAATQRAGMEALVTHLAQHRRDGHEESDETLLRLESDEELVRIVTIHRSKGLEYPIVFCPFLWDGKARAGSVGGPVLYHDPARDNEPVLDLGSEQVEQHRALAHREAFAESLRLAYVALTRARHRCYLIWGRIKEAEGSALAWLLHAPPDAGAGDPLAAAHEHFTRLGEAGMRRDLERLATKAGGAIAIEELPAERAERYRPPTPAAETLAARALGRAIERGWAVSSYSAIATGRADEQPDYDETREPRRTPPADGARSIAAFPRGARAGICLHAIFEHVDFAEADDPALDALVDRTLRAHGFDTVWSPVVTDTVRRTLATPLDETGTLRLAGITRERRVDELEFYYPVADLRSEKLRALLAQHGIAGAAPEHLEQIRFAPLHGYLKGFIDLVFEAHGRFYIADYKSNWLGATPQDYRADVLARVMGDEAYYLQYLIYTVAVHRYLHLRIPDYDYDRHFGGVFYLFVRGLDPSLGHGSGVFRDRPARALIDALDRYLGGSEGGGTC
jgi:exodeoxyribonuclease V beta subunit